MFDKTKYYFDVDNELQKYDDWCVDYIEEYKDKIIVKDQYDSRYMMWSRWNRAFSTIGNNNEYIPLKFDTLKDLKKYIDSLCAR